MNKFKTFIKNLFNNIKENKLEFILVLVLTMLSSMLVGILLGGFIVLAVTIIYRIFFAVNSFTLLNISSNLLSIIIGMILMLIIF